MGREAQCLCRVGEQSAEAKVLLESDALLLRGVFKRRYALTELSGLHVEGERLCFEAGGESVALELGAKPAASWLKKIATPPPTLADKLGLSLEHKGLVIGALEEPALLEALRDARTELAAEAHVALAVVSSEAQLLDAIAAHAGLPDARHLWVIHPKGSKASLADATVRRLMMAAGYADSKTSAVSETLTATRYARR
ncbi:hypothetical protein [Roseateles toxinivorans]|uniref:Uncharacterized protein n=1 Tax=Roseateles toxinivorans TaxID=270368 RepID=A0A4R6QJ23_9BURK|nr:hypothetical protein [Roseateles toxinivorans]TDP62256.1 hypothetical protein DES47_10868 [Roseateles toxinivorans]